MINYIKNKIRWNQFIKSYEILNKDNHTVPKNIFDINKVSIGRGTYGPIEVYSWKNDDEGLIIGKYCSIARFVKFILGGNHSMQIISTYSFGHFFEKKASTGNTKGKINIGDGVWIGMGATILSGVTIGEGAAIGANSLVSKDVPPYAIVGGNPIQVLKYRFPEDIRRRLEALDYYSYINEESYKSFKQILSKPVTNAVIDELETLI